MENAIIIGIVLVALFLVWRYATKKKPGGYQRGGVVVRQQRASMAAPQRVNPFAVIFNLFVITPIAVVIYAVLVGLIFTNLESISPTLREWAVALMLPDIFGFAACFMWTMPAPYRRYMQNKPEKIHTPLDWLVGLVLSVYFLAGMGYHVATLGGFSVLTALP